MIHGARWNSPGRRVIYAAETYAGGLLEVLVHATGAMPANQSYIRIDIPRDIRVERLEAADLPGWDAEDLIVSRAHGDLWYDSRRTAVLVVPSVVARVEHIVLINQEHLQFKRISATDPMPVRWDARLWSHRQFHA